MNFRGPNANHALLDCFSDCLAIANREINSKREGEREGGGKRERKKQSEAEQAKQCRRRAETNIQGRARTPRGCLLALSTPSQQPGLLLSGLCGKVPGRRAQAKTSTNHSASIRGGEREKEGERKREREEREAKEEVESR